MKQLKRICLFAGYSKDNKIEDYVVDYIQELSKYADIYYFADGDFDNTELEKIAPFTKGAWAKKHNKYDFGSISELVKNFVGWEEIKKYDEMIIANDSCYCVNSFAPVFEKMNNQKLDAWGLTASDDGNIISKYNFHEYCKLPKVTRRFFCINSYFMVFRKKIINNQQFRELLSTVKKERDRFYVCVKYELGLTEFLINNNFKVDLFISTIYTKAYIYSENAFRILKQGMPLIKTRIFSENPYNIKNLDRWIEFIARITNNNKIYNYVNLKLIPKTPKFPKGPLIYRFKQYLKNKNKLRKKEQFENSINGYFPSQIKDYGKKQLELLKPHINSESIVIYFSVARDLIGGGLLSINRFVENTKPLCEKFNFDLIVSGLPLSNAAIRHTMFEPALDMIDFNYIVKYLKPDKAVIHLPEVFVEPFLEEVTQEQIMWMKTIPNLQINIMDQNNDLMPPPQALERIPTGKYPIVTYLTDNVTITVAHKGYCTQEMANKYNMPVSMLTPFLPEFYRTEFEQKENIIVLSPDNDVFTGSKITRQNIIEKIKTKLPEFEIITIENMSLEKYKQTITKAKFAITFGEGYDGYFVEPYLSNSIAFAVYNSTYFPSDFKHVSTVYKNTDKLCENIVSDIKKYNSDPETYKNLQKNVEKLIRKYTNNEISKEDLERFFRREYSFYPW